jgi:uncharacterized protein YoxC
MKELEEEILDRFSPKEKREMKKLEDNIQETLEKYDEEYSSLAGESEKLYEKENKLKEKYAVLNKKTGLDKLYEKLENYFKIEE